MRQETFTLSQRELQRVTVINACIKGGMACARAAGLLCLSVRQVKRLKKRMREEGEAALAHADCCASTGSARRENAVLPLIASAAHVPLGSANSCNLTAAHTTGSKAVVRGSPLSVCRTTPPAKSWPLGSSPRRPLSAISACFANCCAASACPWLFMAITVASSSATTTAGRWKSNSPENVSPPSSAAPWNNSASPSSPPTARRPKAASRGSGACCKIASPANCGWLKLPTSTPPTPCCASSSPTTTAVLPGCLAKTPPPGSPAPESLERICCFIHERTVSNDNVVQWAGRRFQIPKQARRFSFAAAKVHIYQALNGRLSFYYGDTRLEHSAIPGG